MYSRCQNNINNHNITMSIITELPGIKSSFGYNATLLHDDPKIDIVINPDNITIVTAKSPIEVYIDNISKGTYALSAVSFGENVVTNAKTGETCIGFGKIDVKFEQKCDNKISQMILNYCGKDSYKIMTTVYLMIAIGENTIATLKMKCKTYESTIQGTLETLRDNAIAIYGMPGSYVDIDGEVFKFDDVLLTDFVK